MTDFSFATIVRCQRCGRKFCAEEGDCPDCGSWITAELSDDEYEVPEDEK